VQYPRPRLWQAGGTSTAPAWPATATISKNWSSVVATYPGSEYSTTSRRLPSSPPRTGLSTTATLFIVTTPYDHLLCQTY
jgi:hypothetical protein